MLKSERKVEEKSVVCAIVKADIHDIEKFLLVSLLISYYFYVIDLGENIK